MRRIRTLNTPWTWVSVLLCATVLSGCGDDTNEKPGSRPDEGMTLIEQEPPEYAHFTEGQPMTAEQRAAAPPRKRAEKGNLAAAYVGAIQDRDIVAATRLRSIAALINVYRKRNDGAYPKSLSELIDVGLAPPKLMQSARNPKRQMVYHRPVGPRPGWTILLHDPYPNEHGKTTACQIDLVVKQVESGTLSGTNPIH
jgi:hypothetical protein